MTAYAYCSGVLPYTCFNNNIYYLLGKSRRHGRLSTFSGKNEQFDQSVEDTAAREFFEESLGAIMDRSAMLQLLRKENTVRLESRTPRGMPCHTFVVEIPYRKHYSLVFSKMYNFLDASNIRRPELLEMIDLKWVCSRSMLTRVRKQWERYGVLTSAAEWAKLEAISPLNTWPAWSGAAAAGDVPDPDADADGDEADASDAVV